MSSFRRLAIPEVVEIFPQRHFDERGFLSETYEASAFAAEGLPAEWPQENHSYSDSAGTVRGLHFQVPPAAQAKLVRVVSGAIFDVAVDLRKGSGTYGRWVGTELSAERWNQLYVPAGFAHGFMTLTRETHVLYKLTAPYSPGHEGAIRWDDPDIAIDWPQPPAAPTCSERDMSAASFAGFETPFRTEAN